MSRYTQSEIDRLTGELEAERADHADTMRRARAAWAAAEDRYALVERAIKLLEAGPPPVGAIDELRDDLRRSAAKANRLCRPAA